MAAEELSVFGQPIVPTLVESELANTGCSDRDDSGFDLNESLYAYQTEGEPRE